MINIKNKNILFTFFSVMLLTFTIFVQMSTVLADDPGELDQSYTGGNEVICSFSDFGDGAAQGFKPTVDTLNKIEVNIYRTTNDVIDKASFVMFSIWDSPYKWEGNLIWACPIKLLLLPDSQAGWRTIEFNDYTSNHKYLRPVTVDPGSTYYLRFELTATYNGAPYNLKSGEVCWIGSSNSNAYINGDLYSCYLSENDEWMADEISGDVNFKIYGFNKNSITITPPPSIGIGIATEETTKRSIKVWWESDYAGDYDDYIMIRRSMSDYPQEPNDGYQVYFGRQAPYQGGRIVVDEGLIPNCRYYYSAWSYDRYTDKYSNRKTKDTATTLEDPYNKEVIALFAYSWDGYDKDSNNGGGADVSATASSNGGSIIVDCKPNSWPFGSDKRGMAKFSFYERWTPDTSINNVEVYFDIPVDIRIKSYTTYGNQFDWFELSVDYMFFIKDDATGSTIASYSGTLHKYAMESAWDLDFEFTNYDLSIPSANLLYFNPIADKTYQIGFEVEINAAAGVLIEWSGLGGSVRSYTKVAHNPSRNVPYIQLKYSSQNVPPNKPTCKWDKENNKISVSSTDDNGDQIRYGVSWKNNRVVDSWTGYYDSGEEVSISCGDHKVTAGVIAEDEHGAQSSWISVDDTSKTKSNSLINNKFLEKLFALSIIKILMERVSLISKF